MIIYLGRYSSNISLNGHAWFYLRARSIDIYDCPDVEAHWKIQRSDEETEMYTAWNETYHYVRRDNFSDRGLTFDGRFRRRCSLYMTHLYEIQWSSDHWCIRVFQQLQHNRSHDTKYTRYTLDLEL